MMKAKIALLRKHQFYFSWIAKKIKSSIFIQPKKQHEHFPSKATLLRPQIATKAITEKSREQAAWRNFFQKILHRWHTPTELERARVAFHIFPSEIFIARKRETPDTEDSFRCENSNRVFFVALLLCHLSPVCWSKRINKPWIVLQKPTTFEKFIEENSLFSYFSTRSINLIFWCIAFDQVNGTK